MSDLVFIPWWKLNKLHSLGERLVLQIKSISTVLRYNRIHCLFNPRDFNVFGHDLPQFRFTHLSSNFWGGKLYDSHVTHCGDCAWKKNLNPIKKHLFCLIIPSIENISIKKWIHLRITPPQNLTIRCDIVFTLHCEGWFGKS